jgi:hypothetical protein
VCGAKSCPPIKLYTPENLHEGLQVCGLAPTDTFAIKLMFRSRQVWHEI